MTMIGKKMQAEQFTLATKPMSAGQAINLIRRIAGVKISRSTLWRWRQEGRLRGVRIGKRLFTTEQWIRDMLQADRETNRSEAAQRGLAAAERLREVAPRCGSSASEVANG